VAGGAKRHGVPLGIGVASTAHQRPDDLGGAAAEAQFGFLDLSEQLGSAATASFHLIWVQLIEDALPPAIEGAQLFAPGQELLDNDLMGAAEHARWVSLGKSAV